MRCQGPRPAADDTDQMQRALRCSPFIVSGRRFIASVSDERHGARDHVKGQDRERQLPREDGGSHKDEKEARERKRHNTPLARRNHPCNVLAPKCNIRGLRSAIVPFQFVGDDLGTHGSPTLSRKRLDVNEHFFAAATRGDESKTSVIHPARYFAFVAHVSSHSPKCFYRTGYNLIGRMHRGAQDGEYSYELNRSHDSEPPSLEFTPPTVKWNFGNSLQKHYGKD